MKKRQNIWIEHRPMTAETVADVPKSGTLGTKCRRNASNVPKSGTLDTAGSAKSPVAGKPAAKSKTAKSKAIKNLVTERCTE